MYIFIGMLLGASLASPSIVLNTGDIASVENGVIVDTRDADAFAAGHLPGAAHLDVETLSEVRDGVNGLLKPVEELLPLLADAGLDPAKTIVIYSGMENAGSLVRATRLLWVLEYLGYSDVRLLDGGLAKWNAEGRPVETGTSAVAAITPDKLADLAPQDSRLATREEVMATRSEKKGLIVDLRGPEYFSGAAKSGAVPKAGHIPGAKSRPGEEFLEGPYFTFKSPESIRDIVGADRGSGVITYCNTGRVATVGYAAYRIAGFDDVALYDGSMSEWGSHEECPVATGNEE